MTQGKARGLGRFLVGATLAALLFGGCGGVESNSGNGGSAALPEVTRVTATTFDPVNITWATDAQAVVLPDNGNFQRVFTTADAVTIALQDELSNWLAFNLYANQADMVAQTKGTACLSGSCSFSSLTPGDHFLEVIWASPQRNASLWLYDGSFTVGDSTLAGAGGNLTPTVPLADVLITVTVVAGQNASSWYRFHKGANTTLTLGVGTPTVAGAALGVQLRGDGGSPILGICSPFCILDAANEWIIQVSESGGAATPVELTLTLVP